VDHRHRRQRHETDRRTDDGGMVSSTILTLIVIPVLYFIWKRRIMSSDSQSDRTITSPVHEI